MECPACWANKLFQIERNSRRLNRAMWNISSCSFSRLPIGKAERREKTCLPLFGAMQVAFVHPQSILRIELQLKAMSCQWQESQCFWHKRHAGTQKINAHFRVLSVCMKNSLLYYLWEGCNVAAVWLWAVLSCCFLSQQHDAVWMSALILGHDNQYSQCEMRRSSGWGLTGALHDQLKC